MSNTDDNKWTGFHRDRDSNVVVKLGQRGYIVMLQCLGNKTIRKIKLLY